MTGQSIQQLLMEKQLLICVGAGGVGKTSMAATMGVHAAMMGRKVLVLTIDPAKRLANSLGLHEFGNEETQIDLTSLGDTKGELWAMMLDGKHAFHELIDRVAEDEATKKAIYDNNIYQSIADTIVGNQEYMATEKLYDVIHLGGYDLVILDTPPVKNALDFLESPGRMAQFVDKRIMQWFLADGKDRGMLRRLISGTSSKIFGLLGHVFGKDFLEDIVVFF
jgi:anion-transporting  ArsA/GET3 family ATPase